MSYIIRNNAVIATTSEFFKSGDCLYSEHYSEESINASFSKSLANARSAKISNSVKWAKEAAICPSYAKIVDPYFQRDFLVV